MKKVLAVVAVVCVVCAAGAALAQPGANGREGSRRLPPQAQQWQQPQNGQPQYGPRQQFAGEPRFEGRGRKCGGRRGMMFTPDMPEEIKAKVVEAEKLKVDLEAAMSARPIDKAKAMEFFGQLQKAKQEIEAWKFSKKLDGIEAFRKQLELNRNVPPAPPAPAPEAPAENAD